MGTVDEFLTKFNYQLDERLDGEKKSEFDGVTKYFDENNRAHIDNFYTDTHQAKIKMADKIVMICLNVICNHNVQVHIINKSFRTLLLQYAEWREKTVSHQESISIKADINILILVHQIKQLTIYAEKSPSDPWRKEIEEMTLSTGYKKGFIQLFFGMFT